MRASIRNTAIMNFIIVILAASLTGCTPTQYRGEVLSLQAFGGYGLTTSTWGAAAGAGAAYMATEKK